MIRIALLAATAALFVVTAQADEADSVAFGAGFEELSTRLALTPAQEARIMSILEDHIDAQQAVLERHGIDIGSGERAKPTDPVLMREIAEEIGANRVRFESRLSGILSEAQLAGYRRFRAELNERFTEFLMSWRVDTLVSELNLSSEQTDRARPVLEEHLRAKMAILEGHGIDLAKPGERLGLWTLLKLRRDIAESREEIMERLSAILTEAQLEAFEELEDQQEKRIRALLLER